MMGIKPMISDSKMARYYLNPPAKQPFLNLVFLVSTFVHMSEINMQKTLHWNHSWQKNVFYRKPSCKTSCSCFYFNCCQVPDAQIAQLVDPAIRRLWVWSWFWWSLSFLAQKALCLCIKKRGGPFGYKDWISTGYATQECGHVNEMLFKQH